MDKTSSNYPVTSKDLLPNDFEKLEAYPWSEDPEFQSGLHAILGPSQSRTDLSRTKDLTLRARCFYYARKYNVQLDFDAYRAWRESQHSSALSSLGSATCVPSLPTSEFVISDNNSNTIETSHEKSPNCDASRNPSPQVTNSSDCEEITVSSSSEPAPGYPPTFADIMELIKTGQPIPGIKDIPDIVLEGQGTESTKTKRRKPWEIAQEQRNSENISLFPS